MEQEPRQEPTGEEILQTSIEGVGKAARERRERQMQGLRHAFEVALDEYAGKYDELPSLQTETDVDRFVRARPDLWRAIQQLDVVLDKVQEVALEVMAEKSLERDRGKEAPGEQAAAA